MNTSGEVADLFVKEGIQITEAAAKLAGLGAKNLAAIIIALLQEDNKLQGKVNLKQLLKSEKPLCILQIKENDIHKFNKEAKRYGVLFTAVTDKNDKSGFCDIIAKQDDVAKLNYIMEKMGYTSPSYTMTEEKPDKPEKADVSENAPTEDKSKNSTPRAKESQSKKKSTTHGEKGKIDGERKSVKLKIEDIKRRSKSKSNKEQEPTKAVKDAVKNVPIKPKKRGGTEKLR